LKSLKNTILKMKPSRGDNLPNKNRVDRTIDVDHSGVCFKPCGIGYIKLKRVLIYEDEMEALRLSDYEGLYQQECADKMGISRTTFSRLITTARNKIADALLHNKALRVNMKKK